MTDQAKGGRFDDADATVGLFAFGRDQNLEGGGERGDRTVVNLAVGEGDDAGEASSGDIGEGAVDGGEHCGAVGAGAGGGFGDDNGAHLEVGEAGGLLLELGESGVAEGGPCADAHGVGLVDDEEADVGKGVASLLD